MQNDFLKVKELELLKKSLELMEGGRTLYLFYMATPKRSKDP